MPIDVSEQIKEAIERGEFKDLPGKGEPLKLDTNPLLTPQARMAHRLLKENGFGPRWIELEKEIKQEKTQLETHLITLKTRRERLVAFIAQYPHRHEAISRSFEYERARSLARYSEKLENLNRKIQHLNLLMPTRNRQHGLINKEAALDRFQETCPSL